MYTAHSHGTHTHLIDTFCTHICNIQRTDVIRQASRAPRPLFWKGTQQMPEQWMSMENSSKLGPGKPGAELLRAHFW